MLWFHSSEYSEWELKMVGLRVKMHYSKCVELVARVPVKAAIIPITC
jgi:hypothetical protein